MLPSRSGILAEAISSTPTSLQQRQSISLASFLQYLHFRSSRLELFCKKGVLKNFTNLTGVSFGASVSCKFCEILKNVFFHRMLLMAASDICTNRDSNTECNKSAAEAYVQFISMLENVWAKYFIFVRTITFFIEIKMWRYQENSHPENSHPSNSPWKIPIRKIPT